MTWGWARRCRLTAHEHRHTAAPRRTTPHQVAPPHHRRAAPPHRVASPPCRRHVRAAGADHRLPDGRARQARQLGGPRAALPAQERRPPASARGGTDEHARQLEERVQNLGLLQGDAVPRHNAGRRARAGGGGRLRCAAHDLWHDPQERQGHRRDQVDGGLLRRGAPPLHLLCTSPAPPLHLPCTSSAPPLHLLCTCLHTPAPRTRSASPSRTRSAPPTPHHRVAPTPHPLHAPSPRTCFAPVRTHSASTPRIRSAAPTPHHLAPTTQHPVAPIPSVQAARFTDVALRRCLSAAGARLTSLTLHQLPTITASGLAPLRLLPKLATGA